ECLHQTRCVDLTPGFGQQLSHTSPTQALTTGYICTTKSWVCQQLLQPHLCPSHEGIRREIGVWHPGRQAAASGTRNTTEAMTKAGRLNLPAGMPIMKRSRKVRESS